MARVFKKRNQWWIDYRTEGRRVRIPVGESKKLAQNVLSKKLTEIAENRHLDVQRTQKVKFEDFVNDYIELHAKHKKSFRSSYLNSIKHLLREFSGRFLDEIDAYSIATYKNKRQQIVSDASVNRELACLKSIFNKAIEWQKIKESPASRIKLFKERNARTRYLTEGELSRLLEQSSERLKAVIIIAINTGMRKSEMQNLRWEDINFTTNLITLEHTKNGERRYIPINETVKKILLDQKEFGKSEYVFIKSNGEPYNVRKSFETALKKADIKDFRWHDCRHTCASYLVMRGVDLNTVRELLGHKSLEMTLRYSHLSQSHMLNAVQKLNSVFLPTSATAEVSSVTAN